MRLLKAYRFRLEPTPTVAREMGRIAGCCRFVFNRGVALQRERFERKEKHLGYAELCKELTSWRHAPDTEFLTAAPIHPLQQALKDLDRAYRNFFEGRAHLPRFKSILDQGWAEFRRQLEYKQTWRGGIVVVIDPRNTSRTCPCCGHVSAENRKTQAVFRCVRCGHAADADVNAAKNILAAGHAVIACGDTKGAVRPPAQEPTVSEAA